MTDDAAAPALLAAANETIRTLAEENAALLAANTRLRRERDDARDISIRGGAWQNGAGVDYEAHLEAINDESVRMPLVDPDGRAFSNLRAALLTAALAVETRTDVPPSTVQAWREAAS